MIHVKGDINVEHDWKAISKEEASFQRSTASLQDITALACSPSRCTGVSEFEASGSFAVCPSAAQV